MPKPTPTTKGRALPPSPNESLFKFKLTWRPDSETGFQKKETWYSYDYGVERERYPRGLDLDTRRAWQVFLQMCWKHEELYEFLKWARPHTAAHNVLHIYLPNWAELIQQRQHIQAKYEHTLLETYTHTADWNDVEFRATDPAYPKQPGTSAGRAGIFRDCYGFKYLHRNDFIVTNLASGRLLKVDIYDNLMYHTENHLHTLLGRQPTYADDHTPNVAMPKTIAQHFNQRPQRPQ
jgi:hypothetical protein